MNKRNDEAARDDVLFAFHQSCEHPTVEQIIEWSERYPEFADEIREHASIRLDWAAMPEEPHDLDETMLSRSRSRALNAIYNAQRSEQSNDASSPEATWEQIVSSAGFTIPQLARQIDIDRSVLAELAAGRMRLPIGQRLTYALTTALGVGKSILEVAVTKRLTQPRLGQAKADREPTIVARSYEEIIRSSQMPDERKRYWLVED
jgi:hypothetical protein